MVLINRLDYHRVYFQSKFFNGTNRPTRCAQFKSPGAKIPYVLYLHYNVAFTLGTLSKDDDDGYENVA